MGSGKEENAEPGWITPDLLQSLLSLRGLSKLELAHLQTTMLPFCRNFFFFELMNIYKLFLFYAHITKLINRITNLAS